MSGLKLFFKTKEAATGQAVKQAAKAEAKAPEPPPEPAPPPERKGNKRRLTREQKLAAIEKKYAGYISEEKGKEGRATKAYNKAVASGDPHKIAIANANWYWMQYAYTREWNKAAGKGKDPTWQQNANKAYVVSLRELNASGATIPESLKAHAIQVAEGDKPKPESTEDTQPIVEEVDKPEQGTPQAKLPFSERQEKLRLEMRDVSDQAAVIDSKLEQIDNLRSSGDQDLTPADARLIASEFDLKKERAALDDKMAAFRRSQQALGGGDEGVPGRSATPTGEGHREAIRRLQHDKGRGTRGVPSAIDKVFGLGVGRPSISGAVLRRAAPLTKGIVGLFTEPGGSGIALSRAKKEHLPESPAGHLFAPKPKGGASPEALEALKKRRDDVEDIHKVREDELMSLEPFITRTEAEMVPDMRGGRSHKDPLKQKALYRMLDRRSELLRLQETGAPETPGVVKFDPNTVGAAGLDQMQRGISHMESVLSEQEQE